MSALCHLERYHKNPHRDGKYFGFSKDAEYPSLYENPDSQYESKFLPSILTKPSG